MSQQYIGYMYQSFFTTTFIAYDFVVWMSPNFWQSTKLGLYAGNGTINTHRDDLLRMREHIHVMDAYNNNTNTTGEKQNHFFNSCNFLSLSLSLQTHRVGPDQKGCGLQPTSDL